MRNGVSKDFFFFPRCRQKRWKKILFEFFRGENRRANPEALLLPVPTRGQRAGSIPEKAGPHREDRQLFWLSLPLRAPPVHAPSRGRQLVARAPPAAVPRSPAGSEPRAVPVPETGRSSASQPPLGVRGFRHRRKQLGVPAALSPGRWSLVRTPEHARDAAGAASRLSSSAHGQRDRALGALPVGF